MADKKPLYTSDTFPYAAIFDQLTTELLQHNTGPIHAFARFQQLRRKANLLAGADYCSTAITSGGHAHRPDLTRREVIVNNTANARQLVTELVQKGCLHTRSAVLPVDLGYIPGWDQSDYMMFWLAVIAGFDLGLRPRLAAIEAFRAKLLVKLHAETVNLSLMNDHTVDASNRATEYFKFARAFATLAASFRPEPHSAHRVINLIDTRTSLGAQTERLFAHLRGIPVYDVKVTGPARNSRYAFGDLELYKDLELIFSYGGTTIELSHTHSFMLQERPQSGWLQKAMA